MKKLLSSPFACFAAIALAAVFAGCEKKPELHIYTWTDYISPEVIEGFEESNNCKVVIDTFESNEQMYAKLKAGGTGYDIIMPSSYFVGTMAKEGLIVKLDHSKMPNVKTNFDPAFIPQIIDESLTYSVPYCVTYGGFMYLKDKVPEGADIESWTVLANPALKGKITLLDDIREVIGAGLMYNGFSINSKNAAEIDKAVETVLEWRRNIRKFDAESYKTEVPSGATWVGHGYSTDTTQVIIGDEEAGQDPRGDIGFALPKEGFSIAFDEMVVAATAPNPELAYAFMNYVYEGEVAKVNMEYILGPTPVKPGIDALDAEFRELVVLSADKISHGQVIKTIDDDPEAKALWDKAWDRIKATDAN